MGVNKPKEVKPKSILKKPSVTPASKSPPKENKSAIPEAPATKTPPSRGLAATPMVNDNTGKEKESSQDENGKDKEEKSKIRPDDNLDKKGVKEIAGPKEKSELSTAT